MNSKKFYITTLGCPKNVADSASMHQSLLEEGFVPSSSPEEADFHLINTCTFIREATEETIQTILDAGEIKKQKDQKLVVVGCFAQRYPEAIRTDLPEVDFLFGTGKYDQAGKILKENFPLDSSGIREFHEDILERSARPEILPENFTKPYAFVKVSDGCNRGCAFCIIPSLRGKFRELPENQILEQARIAIQKGAKEICLVSQDTIYYHRDESRLAGLLTKLSSLEGLAILRPLYLYPDKKTFRLLDYFPQIPKLAPYLESPLQHVSSKVLKAMNRSGDYPFFKDLFQKARESLPGLEIRTSFILGFPGETSEDVEMILKFLEELKPEKVNLFPYSPQEGTRGYEMRGKPSDKEIARRVNLVREVHLKNLEEIHTERLGKVYHAILDERSEDGSWVARRFQDAPEIDEVVFLSSDFQAWQDSLSPGKIGFVKVESFQEYDMTGSWIESQ